MGQNRAPHPSRGWIVRYIGGGPLDGGIRVKSEPIQGHHIPVEDGPFAGHQCYDLVGWSPEDQVIVLAYSGERWGPKLDDG